MQVEQFLSSEFAATGGWESLQVEPSKNNLCSQSLMNSSATTFAISSKTHLKCVNDYKVIFAYPEYSPSKKAATIQNVVTPSKNTEIKSKSKEQIDLEPLTFTSSIMERLPQGSTWWKSVMEDLVEARVQRDRRIRRGEESIDEFMKRFPISDDIQTAKN